MEDKKKKVTGKICCYILWGLIVLFATGVVVFSCYDLVRGISDVGKQGNFTLGCGKLDGQDYYTCYQVLDDGG